MSDSEPPYRRLFQHRDSDTRHRSRSSDSARPLRSTSTSPIRVTPATDESEVPSRIQSSNRITSTRAQEHQKILDGLSDERLPQEISCWPDTTSRFRALMVVAKENINEIASYSQQSRVFGMSEWRGRMNTSVFGNEHGNGDYTTALRMATLQFAPLIINELDAIARVCQDRLNASALLRRLGDSELNRPFSSTNAPCKWSLNGVRSMIEHIEKTDMSEESDSKTDIRRRELQNSYRRLGMYPEELEAERMMREDQDLVYLERIKATPRWIREKKALWEAQTGSEQSDSAGPAAAANTTLPTFLRASKLADLKLTPEIIQDFLTGQELVREHQSKIKEAYGEAMAKAPEERRSERRKRAARSHMGAARDMDRSEGKVKGAEEVDDSISGGQEDNDKQENQNTEEDEVKEEKRIVEEDVEDELKSEGKVNIEDEIKDEDEVKDEVGLNGKNGNGVDEKEEDKDEAEANKEVQDETCGSDDASIASSESEEDPVPEDDDPRIKVTFGLDDLGIVRTDTMLCDSEAQCERQARLGREWTVDYDRQLLRQAREAISELDPSAFGIQSL